MDGAVDNNFYEFGEYRLDAREGVLLRGEEMVILPPKVFETLFLLVKKQGAIISKTEMLNTIWADSFVEESNLTQNIYTLRKILGKSESGKQLIETVARRGYRIALPVRVKCAEENRSFDGGPPKNDLFIQPEDLTGADSMTGGPNGDAHSIEVQMPKAEPAAHFEPETISAPSEVKANHGFFRRAGVIIVPVFFILFALGVSYYYFASGRGEKTETKIAPIEQLRFQRLTDSGDVVYPAISPNGELLAYVRLEDDKGSVWVKQTAVEGAMQILPPSEKGYRSLIFSPDGKYLFFRQDIDGGAIYQTSIIGGTPKKVAENVWSDFNISPDGRQLVFIRRNLKEKRYMLVLSNVDGSGERVLSSKPAPEGFRSGPSFSPDGTKIAVAAGMQAQFSPKLLIVNVSDAAETELKTPRWRAFHRVLWLPNGENLIVSARAENEPHSQLWLLSSRDGGEVRRLTNDLEAYFWISLSADGSKLVTRQQKIFSHLWLLPDGDLKKAKQLTFGGRNLDGYVGLAWTPDDKIIFSAFSNSITDLYSINLDGSERLHLTANHGRDNNHSSVSPDGRFIVFTSNRTGSTQIWRMDNDGGNKKQLTFLENPNERVLSPVLSPDGKEVYFIKRGGGPAAIWKIPFEGGQPVQVSHLKGATTEGFVAISPDGKYLAYHHVADKTEADRENQKFRIGVLPADGSGEPQIFELSMRRPFVQWTSETSFDYTEGAFNTSSLWRQTINGGGSQKLLEFPDRVFNFVWSRDVKNLVVARGKQNGDAILITNLP